MTEWMKSGRVGDVFGVPVLFCGRDTDHEPHIWIGRHDYRWACLGVVTVTLDVAKNLITGTVPAKWFVAVCVGCNPFQPIPFGSRDDRERWWVDHQERSGHRTVFMMRMTPGKIEAEGNDHGDTDG